MWKTFLAEFKHIFSNKWKAIGWIFMLFIPLIYGFLYMNAYWAPFKHVDSLKIAVVNQDTTGTISKQIAKDISNRKTVEVAGEIYNVNVENNQEIAEHPREAVKSGKYAAVIIIPKGYSNEVDNLHNSLKNIAGTVLTSTISKTISDVADALNAFTHKSHITFYNSYKNNYLAGEMTNFGAGLASLAMKGILPDTSSNEFKSLASIIHVLKKDDIALIEHNKIAPSINTYGKGLSPYFISIALWAGGLVMTFIFKNERHIKDQRTIKHLAGKAACWIFSGWLQVAILMTGLTIQGIDLGHDQWKLFFYGLFVSGIFTMLIMGVAYSIPFGDIGEFAAVILLVLQLISSSGTFPVEMQSWMFRAIHPFVPFTYSVNIFRELLWEPDRIEIIKNMAVLLIYPAITLSIAYGVNRIFDKKTRIIENSIYKYKSFEIHLGDL